jgi:hypothetical protein
MAVKFDVRHADLNFEAGFNQADFKLFSDAHGLLHQLYKGLEPHGVRLSDLQIERGAGTAADWHVLCYLFNFWMTIRIRLDRIEVFCSELTQDYVAKYGSAIVDTLNAVIAYRPESGFRAYGLTVSLHGVLEGHSLKQYLSRFTKGIPEQLGPSIGSGTVMYFGPDRERLLSSVTLDMSTRLPDALYARVNIVWDATKIDAQTIPKLSEAFVRQSLSHVGLEL